jgi:hypothetical protein
LDPGFGRGPARLWRSEYTPAETATAIAAYRAATRRSQPAQWLGRQSNEQVGVYAIAACDSDDEVGRRLACAAARWYYGDNDAEVNKHRFATAQGGAQQVVEKIARRGDGELIDDAMAGRLRKPRVACGDRPQAVPLARRR